MAFGVDVDKIQDMDAHVRYPCVGIHVEVAAYIFGQVLAVDVAFVSRKSFLDGVSSLPYVLFGALFAGDTIYQIVAHAGHI